MQISSVILVTDLRVKLAMRNSRASITMLDNGRRRTKRIPKERLVESLEVKEDGPQNLLLMKRQCLVQAWV